MIFPAYGTTPKITFRFVETTFTNVSGTIFTQSVAGVTGLTPTIDVYKPDGTQIVTADAMDEVGNGVYDYDLTLSLITADGYYRAVATTTSNAVDTKVLTDFVYIDRAVSAPGTLAGLQLGDIVAMAQRRVDHLTTETSGKWSLEWWTSLVNQTKNILAQETGFYRSRFNVTITAATQTSALPSTLCNDIKSINIGTARVDITSEKYMDDNYPGWRFQTTVTSTPTFAVITPPNIEWYPLPVANTTAVVCGSAVPNDLAYSGDQVSGLPAQFGWVLAEGAAALASIGDLYTGSQEAQQNLSFQAFWSGVEQLKRYLDSLMSDR